MQPTDSLSVVRRPLDVEDYIDIVRRHRGWILGPAFAALVIAVVAAFLVPDTFMSESTVQVVPPQVPERYVPSNVNSEMSQRINTMAQSVMSRNNLVNIIQSNNLYRSELQRKPMEDVLELMKRDIHISPVGTLQQTGRQPMSAFKVSFEYPSRMLAQKVTQELTRGFIDENIRAMSQQSTATTEFLKEQWEVARRNLDELETKMTDFRLQNAGRLPDELQANLATLRTLEQQLSGVNEAINRIGQEKLLLESQIRTYKEQLQVINQPGPDLITTQAKSERLAQADREIETLETMVSSLRQRYTDTHPDVKAAQTQLAMLKSRRDALEKEEVQESRKPAPATAKKLSPEQLRAKRELDAAIQMLQSQIQAKDLDLEERTKAQRSLVAMINQYHGRIQSSPIMEGRYAELTRDYNLAKQKYEELNNKKSQSEIATNLENRGQGETLRLLDQASLPETPVKPKRLVIVGAGAGIGMLLGVFLAGFREMKDTSLKNLKDARAYTNLPVLGTIPLLENDLVVRRKRRVAWLAWTTACLIGVLAMTGSIYFHYATRA